MTSVPKSSWRIFNLLSWSSKPIETKCIYVFTKGEKKDKQCDKVTEPNESYCKDHMKYKNKEKKQKIVKEEPIKSEIITKHIENKNKHQEPSQSPKEGYMYLIQFRDQHNQIVYKIGKTKDIVRRIKEYTFPRLLDCALVTDMDECERQLILNFRELFKIAKGNEFFYCKDSIEVNTLRNYFCSFINQYKF